MVRCVNLRLTGGDGSQSHDNVERFRGSQRTSRAIAVRLADHLAKWSFTIPDEKGPRRRMLFLGDQACGSKERWKKVKAVTSVML